MSVLIDNTIAFVKQYLINAEAGHDWLHVERVWKMAKRLAEHESCNREIVELGALLHDIADAKFHQGDETLGPRVASDFLQSQGWSEEAIHPVVFIIENISFRKRKEAPIELPIELQIVQDADRLDALGAIGIARTFHFGGFKNNPIYLPLEKPNLDLSSEEYKKSKGTTINHFYEKLLLLKDLMNTEEGRRIASHRHRFMEGFLAEFYKEWEGEV